VTSGLNVDLTPFIPVLVIFFVTIIVIVVVLRSNVDRTRKPKHRYVPGQFSEQMEIDMRLPYRRFKQLYPESRWTYEEYKRMQMQTAFRRSHSSQDNKRMVR
jgi:hypothetical protein